MKQSKASTREIKSKEIQAQSAREFAGSIIDTVRQPLIVLDADLRVVSANRYFYNTFLVLEKQTVGSLFSIEDVTKRRKHEAELWNRKTAQVQNLLYLFLTKTIKIN